MGKVVTYGLLFVGGVATGLFIAKLYAKKKTEDSVHSVLDAIGLGGGTIEEIADSIIVPQVVG